MMQEAWGDDEDVGGTPMDFSDVITTAKPKVVKTQKPKTRVKAPPPAKYNGPLTVFSVSSSDKGSKPTSAEESVTQIPVKRLNIILDTNIFLSHLSFVEELRDENITGFGRPMLIIPWIVLHELDSLKEGKASDLKDIRKRFKGSVVNKAKSAVHFINSCLTNKHPRVQGQSIQECSKKDRDIYTRSNDDKILQCCLQYKNRARKTTEIVLLSEDMSLRNKAIVSGIHTYTQSGLMKGLAELAKELPKIPSSKSRAKDGKLSPKKSPVKKTSSKQLTKALSLKAADELVDDMICKLKNALRASLSVVLEVEMKAAFDDLWLDTVLKKPPWTFLDILDCYEKHWIAVFSYICNRSIRNCFDKLRIFYKVNKGLGANVKITRNLLEAGLEFLSHLKNHSSYNGALDGSIAHLTSLLEQLDPVKTPSVTTSITPTCSSKPQPSYSSAKHTSNPSAASGKCETLRTLKKVTVRPNTTVRTRRASSQDTSLSEPASKSGVTPKKIKINRASIGSKITPKTAPKTVQNVTPKSLESVEPSSLEQMVDQEIAMDTSTDQISPTRRTSEDSMGQPEEPTVSISNNGETASDIPKFKNIPQKNGNAAAFKFPEDSQSESMKPVPSDKHSSQGMMSHSPCTNTNTGSDQTMKTTLKSPLLQEGGNFSGFSPPSSSFLPSDTSPSSSSTASGMLYSSNSSEEQQVIANSNDVLRVLDTAYKEMYAMCVKVDEAIRMQELGENSTAQLSLKEAFTLVEYLVGYLEKQIVAMTKVLSVVKGNGLMGSISDDVYQELISIIDGFFIGMEINLDGSQLTVEMLKSFISRDDNLLSLERGIDQYRVSLQGCQLCYNLLSQMQT
ncbi:Transcriptional protein SWT1 [Holothuria leucospilota]|uniref:Transcriptional protein SWT1 n=1 Tax=Holothuria leucospilota TaxID=206669 RepID=A0A9Q1HAW2_HOLLE|nr:Transcriptional protein SWT1 [Holothuria leucospilota]